MVQKLARFSMMNYAPPMDPNKVPSPRELQLLALVVTKRIGREVAKLLEQETGKKAPYGTVYTVLGDMAEAGWVDAEDGERNGRRIRSFQISGLGAAALNRGREYYRGLAGFGEGNAFPILIGGL